MKLLTKLGSAFDRIIGVMAGAASVILAFAFLSVCVDVVMRYFLNRPMIWVEELTEESLLYITFLGAAWVLRREGHVKIDLVVNRLGWRAQTWLGIVSSIVGIVISLVLIYYGARVTWDQWVRGVYWTTTLSIPNAYYLVIVPIGSFLLLIQFLRRTYRQCIELRASPEQKQRV